MMNLTSKTSKSFLLFKRTLLLLMMICTSLFVYGKGSKWTATYQVNVNATKSTGSGRVYSTADCSMNSSNPDSFTSAGTVKSNDTDVTPTSKETLSFAKESGEIDGDTDNMEDWTNTKIKYSNVRLVAAPAEGSTFVRWEGPDGNETNNTFKILDEIIIQTEKDGDKAKNITKTNPNTYYPVFIARTFYAYYQPSDSVITIDQVGNVINDDLKVTATPSFQLVTRGPDGITLGKRTAVNANVFSQLADNQGQIRQASYIWDITAPATPCHTYYGWKTSSENYNNATTNNACNVITTSEDSNAPAQHKVYVVYKRDPFNLMEYDAENKITAALAMPYSLENGVQTYTENIPGAELTTKYYRLVLGATGDVEVTSVGGFSAELATEDGKQILVVTPDDNAQEGTIYISVGDKQIAALHLTVNVKPVYVTLNPAEDLTGTYSYTQSTTGTKVFNVTTSPVVKQMITATDYSFSFSPTPQDASKYQFDRWIIRDAEENVIAEYVEPNLTHTFKGDESITPVFTAIDRAVFIVKSEPDVKYVDLQKALDRADALTTSTKKAQTVVVTEGTSKGGRLVKGDYVIRNGVTLLVPGDKTYTPIVTGLEEGHFDGSGTFGTFCTLTVEDNTTITAENGNISVYAKVATTNSSRRVGVWNHGRIHLGKNCQIEVKKGGLYCFGFITGDNTSHVIMDSLTTVYEPFHMTDWRGGKEILLGGIIGNNQQVFPAGQYYVQACEVPLTLKAGATEYLSILIETSFGNSLANVQFVGNYSSTSGLFGLGGKTSLTKYYDPNTDRLHFEFNGNGTASKVKIGNLSLKVSAANVNSEDYVMPIQNNLDIDVKNTTIDVTCDMALMPGAVMRVHDDAVINIQEGVRVYIYDRGARKLRETTNSDPGGYWGAGNSLLIPIPDNARPGGVIYGHKNDKGAFVKGRNEKDLIDAKIVINGVMNVHGELYTVKGPFAHEDAEEPEGGADITSEGSGKINVYNVGTDKYTYQWKQENKAQKIEITDYLLLHNDRSAGAATAYTPVLEPSGVEYDSYTYYQYDGTWRLPEAGITGIKMYDSEDKEIDTIHVTLPNADIIGYLLATLEPIDGLTYDTANFNIPENVGNVALDIDNASISDGKLRIPFTYKTQDKHGIYTADLTITYTKNADYIRTLTMPIVAKEDYTPIFTAPTALNIYGRVSEDNPSALPIQPAEKNVTTLSEDDEVNIEWMAKMTGSNPDQFAFKFGEGEGNMLSGARVIFKPTTEGQKKATLTLTATYTDANNPATMLQKVHTVTLVGNAMKNANTLDFNNVGTITINTEPFDLLRGINSPEQITVTTEQVGTDVPSDVAEITPIDPTLPNSNYTFRPKAVGQLKVKVSQQSSSAYEGITEPLLEKIFMVVANPRPLTDVSCVENDTTFRLLTANMTNVTYDNAQIQFASTESPAVWTAQFASMPGTLTFTPHGSGQWAVQESKDGRSWSELIWWTQLPSAEEVTIPLTPSSRYIQIQYIKAVGEGYGHITDLCINPFAIHAETKKLYVPVEGGVVRSTSIVLTHAAEPGNIQIVGPAGWNVATNSSNNIGGLKNPYYQTTVTLSGGQDVAERNDGNDGFTLTATQTTDNATVTIALATFNFPKPLPMQSALWISDDDVDNVNGYDEAEYYHLYLHESEYAKWDAENQTVVFMNKGSHVDANRRVAFGYHGLPAHVRFQSLTTDWMIEEGVETTEGVEWTPTNTETRVITSNKGINTITQPINHTSKFVRISYVGTEPSEVTIQNVVIEGFPSATAPAEVEIAKANDQATPSATFDIHVMNLPRMQLVLNDTSEFRLLHGDVSNWTALTNADTISTLDYSKMKMNEEEDITIKVEWKGKNLVNEGYIKIINPDQDNKVMATVRLVGKKDAITLAEANTGIWTGVPDGVAEGRPTPNSYTLVGATGDNKVFDAYPYHEVNIKNAFDVNGNALFNYVVIYGETTTKDGSRTITRPTSTAGSNAKTPYYIYERDSIDGKSYRFVQAVEDANSPYKADLSEITHFTEFVVGGVKYYAIQPKNGEPLSFYMTGFCPYATTGSTKDDEGVWYFRGDVNDQVHIYLEDCHLYSRTKSLSGHNTSKTGEDSPDFTEDMVKGSGAVLVFENANPQQNNDSTFNVAIHTRGHNILKSNYGCYYTFLGMAKATQISSPVQVRLGAANHFQTARTTLDFDDLWPLSSTLSDHTNGFLSLQKQANNAPSIDLGNANTIVNFRGGQIQLQNAQVGSPNYKTTLAISYRSGLMGNVKIQMAYGIGTDDVGGTVNFYDGTTTVLPMKVDAAYRSFYLMDTETLKDQQGNDSIVELPTTSCLRTPTKTYVYGGSHCMIRACNHVTSKGGAPKDGPSGQLLGRYVYNNTASDQGYDYRCVVEALPEDVVNYQNGYEVIFENNKYVMEDGEWNLVGDATFTDPCYLVTPTSFPGDLTIQSTGQKLLDYYLENYPNGEYGLHSISPDANGNLSFWVPAGVVPGVTPEEDKRITGWKACMTEIEAGAFGITGRVGGDVSVEFNEEVTNLLYCQLDDNIYSVISDRTKIGVDSLGNEKFTYNYKAPVVDPTGQLPDSLKYQYLPPTHVGDSAQYRIFSEEDYTVTNYLYYITTAQADKWMNFTMPFDVDTIWVVEAYSEKEIEAFFMKENKTVEEKKVGESDMDATLRFQARHNADFAAFFGVAMAIGDDKRSFEDIYKSYIGWAKNKADVENGLYTSGTYDLRGKYPLTHYDGTNFQSSNFYLYHNKNIWYQTESDQFDTQWEIVPAKQNGQPLMRAGETYSLLFPYCLGCDVELDEDNNIVVNEFGLPVLKTRDYWDYWSGKFLIFQSTKATQTQPHVIKGSNYVAPNKVEDNPWLFDKHPTDPTQAILTGNSTFTLIDVNEYANAEHVYEYISDTYNESYLPLEKDQVTKKYPTLTPTTTFLLNGSATRAKMVTREGKIIYDSNPDDGGDDNQNPTTGGNIPTVGGGNDLFITSTMEGINIAVAEPQQVRVMSATGAIIYSGMVQTAVDVLLPTTGVYVITGENEVHKILH